MTKLRGATEDKFFLCVLNGNRNILSAKVHAISTTKNVKEPFGGAGEMNQ